MENLREDWVEVELGEVCNFIGGGTPSKANSVFWNGYLPWASIKDIKGDYLNGTQDNITELGLKNSSANLALPDEIILATRITPGKPIISRIKTAINQDLKVVKPKIKIDTKFLFYSFKSFEKNIVKVSSGTTVLGINLNSLNTFILPLPPLPIQRAIVAKIENLFTSLDKGIADLEKAQQQLKVYRQAVLKKAFEGGLTSTNNINTENSLPDGWNWVKLGEITTILGDGLHGTPKYSDKDDFYFINGNNLVDGKIVIKENTKMVSHSEYEKYKKPLNEKTIFVSINGTLGNVAFYNEEKVILGKSACFFNVNDNIDKNYIRYCIVSHRFIAYAEETATGSTIKNVGLKAMREFKIPLPKTLSEQHQIVREIETRLSVCDKVEQSITESLETSKALRQSILKKAFEGKLLSDEEIAQCRQAADYEPAGELLKKIHATKK